MGVLSRFQSFICYRACRQAHQGCVFLVWVKNDNNISVSLSINFEWKDESLCNVYRGNFFLRKMGITPRPPGRSPVLDAVKSAAMATSFVPAKNMACRTVRFLRTLKKMKAANR
jgi:hypothetical protein